MLRNFGFVIEGVLAGMERPGASASLREDLEFLKAKGIGAVVSLTEQPLERSLLAELGLRYQHLPVSDFGAPDLEQIRFFLAFQKKAEKDGLAVVVHSGAGHGRTGTLLACALVERGLTAGEAIEQLRRLRPGSVETGAQEDFIRTFERQVRQGPHGA